MYNLGGTLNGSTYNSLDGDPLEFVGNYDQDNINEYDSPDGIEPIVVQTMTKSGFNYSNISQINEPASGSRLGMSGHSMNLKAIPAKLSQGQIKRMLSRMK
jgi:hypothetical protein